MGWFACTASWSRAGDARAADGARVDPEAAIDVELSLRGVLRNFGLKLGKISRGGYAARVRELAAGNAMPETLAEAMLRAGAASRAEPLVPIGASGSAEAGRRAPDHDDDAGVGPQVANTMKSASMRRSGFVYPRTSGPGSA